MPAPGELTHGLVSVLYEIGKYFQIRKIGELLPVEICVNCTELLLKIFSTWKFNHKYFQQQYLLLNLHDTLVDIFFFKCTVGFSTTVQQRSTGISCIQGIAYCHNWRLQTVVADQNFADWSVLFLFDHHVMWNI